jgi:3-phosphoshikimate 1-carboxyvinyltransferase
MSEAMRLLPGRPADWTATVPGDKSLTHRAILLGAIAHGTSRVIGALDADDTRASARVARAFGAGVDWPAGGLLTVAGRGRSGLLEPREVLDCGNSGTTMRLAIGIASGIRGALTVLTGDASLRARPMRRVLDPLRAIGGQGWARRDGAPPVAVLGGGVQGGVVDTGVPSAQVKSALLLAGLFAARPVTVRESLPTRDHTERLLATMGARVEGTGPGGGVTVWPGDIAAVSHTIPGDPSSAANWWVLAAITHGRVTTPNVLANPARVGALEVIRRAGASVAVEQTAAVPEPVATVTVTGPARLRPFRVAADEVPALVDEVPLLALLATQADGTSELLGLGELRVKESDRLGAMVEGLRALGAHIEERGDNVAIRGPSPLHGARLSSRGDHRLGFVWAVAASVADGPVVMEGAKAASVSYPKFFEELARSGSVEVEAPRNIQA